MPLISFRSHAPVLLLAAFLILSSLGVPSQGKAQGFSDLSTAHPYYKGIEAIQAKNIIRGNPDGTVRPDAQVSRAELLTLILRATQTEPVGCESQPFSDVSLDQWFAAVVCTAREEGLVGGYPDGTFQPSQNVTFVEAAKIAVQALVPSSDVEAARATLYDNKVNWYDVFLVLLSKRHSIPPTIYSQSQPLTRGEIAQMLYLLLEGTGADASMTYAEFADRLYLDLGGGYKRYTEGIWYDIGGWIDGEDAATFEVLGPGVARDKYRTYMARTGLIGGDPKTNTCSQGWCWDASQVYAQGESIPGADPKTFRVIDKIYAKDAKHVYSVRKEVPNHLVAGADPETFAIVDNRYQRDAQRAFFEGALIPDSHGPSFQVLWETGLDRNHVYNDADILEGADPSTFKFTRSLYAWDASSVYYQNPDTFHYERIPNGDAASFELFPDYVFLDEEGSPYASPEDAHAAGATTVTLKSNFGLARDRARVYFHGKEVLQADPASFHRLHCGFYRDNGHVWYDTVDGSSHVILKMIDGADVHTFAGDPQTCKAGDAKREYPYGDLAD